MSSASMSDQERELHEVNGCLELLLTLRSEFAQWLGEVQDGSAREALENVLGHSVGSLARSADEATPHLPGDKVNFGPAAITDRNMDGHIGNFAWGRDEQAGTPRATERSSVSGVTPRTTPHWRYLVSREIIGAGVIWIVAGTNSATSVLCIAVGVLTIAVGLISLPTELRHRAYQVAWVANSGLSSGADDSSPVLPSPCDLSTP
jgi:hypothetical protein